MMMMTGDGDEDEDALLMAGAQRSPLTEYSLQHGRYEEHCFAAKLVREIAGNDATCCDA